MKVIKDALQNKGKKESKFGLLFKKDEPVVKPYDGSVDLNVTENEYNSILNFVRFNNNKGYKIFIRQAIETFASLTELVLPDSETPPKKWLTFEFDEPIKEALIKEAKRSGLSLEEFVRAVVWTKTKLEQEKISERERRASENQRGIQGYHVSIALNGDLLRRYENKYGKVANLDQAIDGVMEILNKDLRSE